MDGSSMRSMDSGRGGMHRDPVVTEAFVGGVRGMLMAPGIQVPPRRLRDLTPSTAWARGGSAAHNAKGQAVKDCDGDHKYPLNQLLIYPANNRDAGERETGAWQAACREQVACRQRGTPMSHRRLLLPREGMSHRCKVGSQGPVPRGGRACCHAASSRERAPSRHTARGTGCTRPDVTPIRQREIQSVPR